MTERWPKRLWGYYVNVGMFLSAPAFLSYMLAWPYAFYRLSSQGASFGEAIVGTAAFFVLGLLSCMLRVLIWPYGIFGLITGEYASFWAWLFPGFFLLPVHT